MNIFNNYGMEYAVIIDIRTPDEICVNLEKAGLRVLKLPCTRNAAGPLSGHPDIQLFIHHNHAFVHPDIDTVFLKRLEYFCEITVCPTPLSSEYPGDIPYNVACTGQYAIHRTGCTDPVVKKNLETCGITLINTKQGYSKCSTLIVDEKSIITADRSIAGAALEAGIDSLTVTPGYVELQGYKYGFLGGASGRFMDMVLLTGNIDEHPDRENIYEFIESRGLKVKILSGRKAIDTGSILTVCK